jgi:hypothetical protein
LSARKSSRSRFTVPQRRHATRRTSSSRTIRNPALDRSRTCRTRRSYQPFRTRPQQPQTVFLSAGRGARSAHPDHRTRRARSLSLESLRTNTHPTDAAVASLISAISACQNRARLKAKKVPIHKHLRRYDPSKPPTRFPEDPKRNSPALLHCPHIEGIDLLGIGKHPRLLYEAGKDGRALDRVGAAHFAPTPVLVGLDLGGVIAVIVDADSRRDAVGERRFGEFLQRVVPFDLKELF